MIYNLVNNCLLFDIPHSFEIHFRTILFWKALILVFTLVEYSASLCHKCFKITTFVKHRSRNANVMLHLNNLFNLTSYIKVHNNIITTIKCNIDLEKFNLTVYISIYIYFYSKNGGKYKIGKSKRESKILYKRIMSLCPKYIENNI